MTHTNKFKATLSFPTSTLVPTTLESKDGGFVKQNVEDSTTNARNLEVIRLFQKGDLKVSSVSEKISRHNGRESINFDVDFYSQFRSIYIEEIIERFNDVFVIHSISEVKTK
jgi:hypothetical protein